MVFSRLIFSSNRGQPVVLQQQPVLVGEQALAGGHLGNGPILRSQQEEHLTGPSPQPLGISGGHPVQGGGNGPHRVLGQKEAQQPGKIGKRCLHLPQQRRALLQGPAKNLPQLAVLPGQLRLTLVQQRRASRLQMLRGMDLLQKLLLLHQNDHNNLYLFE